MDRKDLRRAVEQLEALEALATLFKNLWFDRIRQEVRDEKARAYLTVFEDAFPHVNHLVRYARNSARLLAGTQADPARWARLQEEFAQLGLRLAGQEEMELPADESTEDELVLATVAQGEVEALLSGEETASPGADGGIDSLFESTEEQDEAEPSQEDIEALLDEKGEGEEEAPGEELEQLEAENLEELMEEEVVELEPEAEAETATEEEDELSELIEALEKHEEAAADSSETAQAEEGGSEEEEVDLGELLGEAEEEEVSEDELSALLNGDEEPAKPARAKAPPPKPAKAPPPKPAPLPKAKAPPPKPAPKGGRKQGEAARGAKQGDQDISQDEIDALFG